MYIDPLSVAKFLVFCIVMVIGVFLIILLYNLVLLVKKANKIVDDNEENVHKTLAVLPETVNNINNVTLAVKDNFDKAGNAISSLGGTVAETAATVNESTGNILEFIKVVNNIIRVILSLFEK